MREIYFLISILAVGFSLEFITYLTPDCRLEMNVNYCIAETKTNLSCIAVCNYSNDSKKNELEMRKDLQPQRKLYRNDEIDKTFKKIVAVDIKGGGLVECSLVDINANSSLDIISPINASIPENFIFPKQNVCGEGYLYFEEIDWCVKISTREQQWNKVPQACISEGGSFAVIDTPEKDKAISEYMKASNIQDIWIGLSDTQEEGKFVWIDGTPLSNHTFKNWHSAQPDDWNRNEDCAHYSFCWNYKWNDVRCDAFFPYLCEKNKIYPEAGPMPALIKGTLACPAGWNLNEISQTCYHTGKELHTFEQSKDYCAQKGGALASIPELFEMKFIQQLLKRMDTKEVWIGLNRIDDLTFRWIDGSPLLYERWASRQPDNLFNNEKCVSAGRLQNYMWNDSSCDNYYLPFCKTNSSTLTISARICPSGCILIQNSTEFKNSEQDCPLYSTESLVCQQTTEDYISLLISVSLIATILFIVLIVGAFLFYMSQKKALSQQHDPQTAGNHTRTWERSESISSKLELFPYRPPPFLPPPMLSNSYDEYQTPCPLSSPKNGDVADRYQHSSYDN